MRSISFFAIVISIIILSSTLYTTILAFAPTSPPGFSPKWRDNKLSSLYYYVDPTFPSYLRQAIREALALWESAYPTIKFIETSSTGSANFIFNYAPYGIGRNTCGGGTSQIVDSAGYINLVYITITNYQCPSNMIWEMWIYVAAHEVGHGLGLGHSQASLSIMDSTWSTFNNYHLFFPLLDDIEYLWLVYGRPQPLFVTQLGSFGNNTSYSGGPFELSYYPYRLIIRQSGTNYYVFYGATRSYLNSKGAQMMVGVIDPMTAYRGAIGFFLSNNPTDTSNRLAILEIDRDGNYFEVKISYSYQTFINALVKASRVITLTSKSYDERSDIDAGYWVQLVVYIDNYYNTKVVAVVYKGTDYFTSLGADKAPNNLLPYNSQTTYIGFAVWTDDSTNPPSDYSFGPIYTS